MGYAETIGGTRYVFPDVKTLLAKATPRRSGDLLATVSPPPTRPNAWRPSGLGADVAAVMIGERPGLSAADSLGVYVTRQPAPGTLDAARNCLSNIRPLGLPIAQAAERLIVLLAQARRHRMTGVALGKRLAPEPSRLIAERG